MKEFSSNYLLFLNQVALDFAVQYVTCLHISLPCLHSPAACLLLLLLTSPGFPCLPPSPPPLFPSISYIHPSLSLSPTYVLHPPTPAIHLYHSLLLCTSLASLHPSCASLIPYTASLHSLIPVSLHTAISLLQLHLPSSFTSKMPLSHFHLFTLPIPAPLAPISIPPAPGLPDR